MFTSRYAFSVSFTSSAVARAGYVAPAADEHPRQALRGCPHAPHVRRVIAPVRRRHRDDERVGPLRSRRAVRKMPAASTV